MVKVTAWLMAKVVVSRAEPQHRRPPSLVSLGPLNLAAGLRGCCYAPVAAMAGGTAGLSAIRRHSAAIRQLWLVQERLSSIWLPLHMSCPACEQKCQIAFWTWRGKRTGNEGLNWQASILVETCSMISAQPPGREQADP